MVVNYLPAKGLELTTSMDTPHTIELAENCDTQWATHFHETMVPEIADGRHIRLMAGNVRRINTPAVQTILALHLSVDSRQGKLEINGASQVFSAAFSDLGLAQMLQNLSGEAHG